MSLNGLDNLKIKEAYDAASAEPRGWFLLKYASRDEVELGGQGNGGIEEIRDTIALLDESSPLFGFLRYRRRNVVIKYVPEECSRLVQARVTVHFNAVTERLSPHDTVFPITTVEELRDSTLSAACSLHTASGSTSSSTSSLRRKRLKEIAEDAEEEARAKRQSTAPQERDSTANTSASIFEAQVTLPSSLQPELPNCLPESTSFNSTVSEAGPYARPIREPHNTEPRPRSPVSERRKSSQSTRQELYSYSSHNQSGGRPKVKLGPRPSLDVAAVGGRPHTSGTASYYRPISTLPAGLKIFPKGSRKEKDRSKHPGDLPTVNISPPSISHLALDPSQDVYTRPHTSSGRPYSISGLLSPTLSSPASPKGPVVTPEKARLMKAIQLRNKKKANANSPPESTLPSSPEGLVTSTSTSDSFSFGAPKEVEDTLVMLDELAKADDSGIAFDTRSTLRTDESDVTRSDSYPVSLVGPSERAESTRASSISDSTDGTIQEPSNPKQEPLLDREADSSGHEYISGTNNGKNLMAPSGDSAEQLEQLSPTVYDPLQEYAANTEVLAPVAEPSVTVEELAEILPMPEKVAQQNDISETQASPPEPLPQGHTSHPEVDASVITKSKTGLEPDLSTLDFPTSKLVAQDPAAVETTSETALVVINEVALEKSPAENIFSAPKDEGSGISGTKKLRPKSFVGPIRTDVGTGSRSRANSEANFSSDDDLMDELSSAVMQEAQPISVSKSPVSPVFPSPKKQQAEPSRSSRVFSTPMSRDKSAASMLELPSGSERPPSRSVSAGEAYLNRINQQQSKPMAMKVNLGSGISQRIKALEKLSSLAPGATPAGTNGPSQGASTSFFSVRKESARAKSPSVAKRANSFTRNSPSASPEGSPDTVKAMDRAGSVRSRLDSFTSGIIPTSQAARSRPESISVTARIIRDPSQPFPARSEAGKDPSEYAPLDLKQSPLVIDHQTAIVQPPKEKILERRLSDVRRPSTSSKTTTKEHRSSITVIKDLISDRQSSFSERRRSMTTIEPSTPSPSASSPSYPPLVHLSPSHDRPISTSSRASTSSRDQGQSLSPPPTAGSSSSTSDEKVDKKSNRASRIMRRMSSSLTASRKTIAHAISPTVREELEPLHLNSTLSLAPSYPSNNLMSPTDVDIGDVNVQFPDSLLWKRRTMLLDSQGYLIISPALSARDKANAGVATRRFHLSEFRMPSIPDVEMQELPNSVVLDFIGGGGLQVACEDRAGQARILDILQESHRSSQAYGQ
ncbi:prolipoprotein diacylglyceryl transferase [Diplocarpon rosae]|nr:prolipoprotein diacylglyceryl transferase [Diplocarpon rosae]